MTLPLPKLDKRDWSDLCEEGLARIPRRAPEWTDFNLHDPGITLLELLAYKTEQNLYQANRVPESLLRNTSNLLSKRHESAPTSIVYFPECNIPQKLKAGTTFEMAPIAGSQQRLNSVPTQMRLKGAIDLYPLSISTVKTSEGVDATQSLYAGTGMISRIPPSPRLDSEPQHTALLFELSLKWNGTQRSHETHGLQLLSIFIDIEYEGRKASSGHSSQSNERQDLFHSWHLGSKRSDENILVEHDGTGGLSHSGVIVLKLNLSDIAEADTLCCRWNTALPWPSRRRIIAIRLNAAIVEHAVPWSDGDARVEREIDLEGPSLSLTPDGFQELDLQSPVVNVKVHHVLKQKRKQWLRCFSLMSQGAESRCFQLEGTVLRFGNGLHGARLPHTGFLVLEYSILQSLDGVNEGTRWKASRAPEFVAETVQYERIQSVTLSVRDAIMNEARRASATNLLSTMASQNGGSLDGIPIHTILSIPSPSHAVTPSDYERLAFESPQVPILRARAFAERNVLQPGLPGSGTLSLIVVPDVVFPKLGSMLCDEDEDRKLNNTDCLKTIRELLKQRQETCFGPASEMSATVTSFLDEYRTMGTKLVVSLPVFSLIQIDISLAEPIPDSRQFEQVKSKIEEMLRKYLDPISGGPRGTGSPMGEAISQRDIFAIVSGAAERHYILNCRVTQIGSWFPWSLPVARIKFDRDNSRGETP